MISANCWVPRGFASEFPEKYEIDDEEFERINKLSDLQLSDAKNSLNEAKSSSLSNLKSQQDADNEIKDDIDEDLKEFDFEHYDDEENGENAGFIPGLSNAKFIQEEEDPYLVLNKPEDGAGDDGEDDDERQDLQVYPSDNLILSARTEDEVSYLDVYVYDDGAGAPQGAEDDEKDKSDPDVARGYIRESSLYVHHDIMLPSFPLCVEWINFRPNSSNAQGNFAAIGTFDPQIELWNLDVVDKAYPDAILGLESSSKGSKKSKKKKKTHVLTHHTDAVLSLSSNRATANILASSSADATVKIWDLGVCRAERSVQLLHQKKTVSSIQWHPDANYASILLSGGYDGSVCVSDLRISEETEMFKRWSVGNGEEVENVSWASENVVYGGTDTGVIYAFDVRSENKPLWKIQAHDSGISSVAPNGFVEGMMVTSAVGDKTAKLWNVPLESVETSSFKPSMVLSRDFGVGNVLSTGFAGDIEVAGHLVAGGVSGPVKMWDAFSNKTVRKVFRDKLKGLQQRAKVVAEESGKGSRIARKYGDGFEEQDIVGEDAGDDDDDDDDGEDGEDGEFEEEMEED